jgi:hypothetical protein
LSGAGKVLQVLSVTKTDAASTSSNSFVDISGLTLTITPTSASSKILVKVSVAGGSTTASTWGGLQLNLKRGTTNIGASTATTSSTAGGAFGGGSGLHISPEYSVDLIGGEILDEPATTSATTYKVQFARSNYSTLVAWINKPGASSNTYSGSGSSTLTLMEIGV